MIGLSIFVEIVHFKRKKGTENCAETKKSLYDKPF